jgi:hypothetical protein
VDGFLNGMEFAFGLIAGLAILFFGARWMRYWYYSRSKLRGDELPPDIRVRHVKIGLKHYEKARQKGMSPEKAAEAYGLLMAITGDESIPMDQKTIDAVGREAVAMMLIAVKKP